MACIGILAKSFCQSSSLRQLAIEKLKGHTVNFFEGQVSASESELIEFIDQSEGIIVGREKLTKSVIDQCKNLKIVSLYGVGHDSIDVAYLNQQHIEFHYQPGVNAPYAAELALGFMITLSRNIHQSSAGIKDGQWIKNGGHSLIHKSVALIGAGHVGSRVARLLRTLGCEVNLCDITDKSVLAKEIGASLVSFAEALNSDVISLHVPLTSLTRHMINSQSLAHMRPGSFLINTSRGEIIDEKALLSHLEGENRQIAGVALDVWENEPHFNRALAAHPMVIGTAHIGGNAREAVDRMGLAAIEGITNYFC
jgi:D-3-phosphoglycerate dehydrogenase